MKTSVAWALLAFTGASGCKKPASTESIEEPAALPDSPEGILQAVKRAVEAQDREALRACFADGGQVATRLDAMEPDAGFWGEIGAVLRGPQDLELKGDWTKVPVGGDLRGRVTAPVAHGGGIGGLTFRRTAAGWRILAW